MSVCPVTFEPLKMRDLSLVFLKMAVIHKWLIQYSYNVSQIKAESLHLNHILSAFFKSIVTVYRGKIT